MNTNSDNNELLAGDELNPLPGTDGLLPMGTTLSVVVEADVVAGVLLLVVDG